MLGGGALVSPFFMFYTFVFFYHNIKLNVILVYKYDIIVLKDKYFKNRINFCIL